MNTNTSLIYFQQERARWKQDLAARIYNEIYLCGELSVADIAKRVGVSKSPSLRKLLAEMCSTGALTHRWIAYKHTGKILFDLSSDTFDNFYAHIPSLAGAEKA